MPGEKEPLPAAAYTKMRVNEVLHQYEAAALRRPALTPFQAEQILSRFISRGYQRPPVGTELDDEVQRRLEK